MTDRTMTICRGAEASPTRRARIGAFPAVGAILWSILIVAYILAVTVALPIIPSPLWGEG